MKLIVPCNACIKRFYRAYAEVDENATDEEIRKAMTEAILTHQGAELTDDPSLEIEIEDIVFIDPDTDSAWIDEED